MHNSHHSLIWRTCQFLELKQTTRQVCSLLSINLGQDGPFRTTETESKTAFF